MPLSALHSSSEGYYVLVLREETTVLGLETIAEKVPVTLIAQDSQNAAVEGMLSDRDDIITQSNKPVQPGGKVRVAP